MYKDTIATDCAFLFYTLIHLPVCGFTLSIRRNNKVLYKLRVKEELMVGDAVRIKTVRPTIYTLNSMFLLQINPSASLVCLMTVLLA